MRRDAPVAAAEDDVPDIPGVSMQFAMSRRAMFLLLNVSSDTLHEKDGGVYSGGDLISWASAILAREGAVAPVQCHPDCPVSSHSHKASVDTGLV